MYRHTALNVNGRETCGAWFIVMYSYRCDSQKIRNNWDSETLVNAPLQIAPSDPTGKRRSAFGSWETFIFSWNLYRDFIHSWKICLLCVIVRHASGCRFWPTWTPSTWQEWMYEGVSKSFRTDRLERELQMVQLSATRCGFIAVLWISLVSLPPQPFVLLLNECLLFLFISLSTQSGRFWIHPRRCPHFGWEHTQGGISHSFCPWIIQFYSWRWDPRKSSGPLTCDSVFRTW
jgi:hypothetical protein